MDIYASVIEDNGGSRVGSKVVHESNANLDSAFSPILHKPWRSMIVY